jgi:hypothetical protein
LSASDEFQVVAPPDRSKPASIPISIPGVEDEALIAGNRCDGTPRRQARRFRLDRGRSSADLLRTNPVRIGRLWPAASP